MEFPKISVEFRPLKKVFAAKLEESNGIPPIPVQVRANSPPIRKYAPTPRLFANGNRMHAPKYAPERLSPKRSPSKSLFAKGNGKCVPK